MLEVLKRIAGLKGKYGTEHPESGTWKNLDRHYNSSSEEEGKEG